MTKKSLRLFGALILIGCVGCSKGEEAVATSVADLESWPRFTSSSGSYSIEMPATPTETTISEATLSGSQAELLHKTSKHTSQFKSSEFVLDPQSVYLSYQPAERLEQLYERSYASGFAKFSPTKRQLEVKGFPALEVTLSSIPPKTTSVMIRLVAADNKIYKTQVMVTATAVQDGYPTRFINSFHIESNR